ncbi:hypothetical protein VB773_14135 [Haloarculaceae archaeon H-GB2-1]|nr:hypothetical protein [Haloarculaceae archaeon H-GB1-1]MEA5408594.1 hypothetical protein [Haloarculaceae archaeon H-GB2-1]
MTLANFGVDPDEPEIEETRYEFETQASPWRLVEPALDESVTPAKIRCSDCGCNLISIDPVLLDYGRDDGLLLACRLCQDCQNVFPSHTVSTPDDSERCDLPYPRTSLRLYDPSRVCDGEYPQWDVHLLRDLDGDLPGGESA